MALTKIKASGIAANAIVTAIIADRSITGRKIAGNTITLSNFEPNVVSSILSIGTSSGVMLTNTQISSNVLIPAGQNGLSVGPITLTANANVTVTSGQRWLIL